MTDILNKAVTHYQSKKDRLIKIEEWGCEIRCPALSLKERAARSPANLSAEDGNFLMAKTVAEYALNKEGKPIFGEVTPKLIAQLQMEVDSNVLTRVFRHIMDIPTEFQAAKN